MATYVNGASVTIPAALPGAVANGNFFRGEMTLVAGLPKTGKSQLAAHLAAVVSAGKDFAPNVPCDPSMKGKRVLIINGERGLQYAPVPRALAAGADMSKLEFVDASTDGIQTLYDVERVVRQCYKYDLGLVIIDPLGSFAPPWGNNATRKALGPLLELAKQRNLVLIGFHHTNSKSGKVQNKATPVALIKGNTEIPNMLVSTWMMAKTDNGTVLEEMICNLRSAGTRYNFTIEGVKLAGMLPTSRLVMTGESQITLEDALETRPKLNAGSNGDRNHWLLSLLAERGQVAAEEVCTLGANKGYSRDQLRRAREELGIPTRQINKAWHWGEPLPAPMPDDLNESLASIEAESPSKVGKLRSVPNV